MEYFKLYNNKRMPALGYGCAAIKEFGAQSDFVTDTIMKAIEVGYRHLDTASLYLTEGNVGKAVAKSGVKREDFFITSKLRVDDMGFDDALRAVEKSLRELNMEYMDLYLIHWPIKSRYLEAWKALERVYEEGLVKAIGGSNFALRHFEGIAAKGNIQPMVNQVELNPYIQQEELRKYSKGHHIVLTAWSPLGTGNWSGADVSVKPLSSPEIIKLGQKYQRSPAQIILRWLVQLGISTIPKSENPRRIEENFSVFDFELEEQDMRAIAGLNKDFSISSEYSAVNRELYENI